ncbi:glyoxylate/hydroxypyruvate reductase A [Robbsia sp. KACC 23696]|uniref:2-hydroxyacid dehydrogenase n=1 Tax=Robbsia sp. KACC 23696 TaxID=3149231 RepID=UPI00325AFC8F
MVLLVKSGGPAALPEWQALFGEVLPDVTVKGWDDADVDPLSVRYVLVWEPTQGRIAQFPNLELVLSTAAGVDHILADTALPTHLDIIRMVTEETSTRMADFVTMASYALLREMPQLVSAQREGRWDEARLGGVAKETPVAILGLGELGSVAAARLAANGFPVLGWSRTQKSLPGVACHSGEAGLDRVLAQARIVVNLLPDTAQTKDLFGAALFAKLPRGASVINAGRGAQLDTAALLAALDSGQVGAAILDVFKVEPLPQDDPLWRHPHVIVTPHVASDASRKEKARQAALNIRAHQAGAAIVHRFDRARGY